MTLKEMKAVKERYRSKLRKQRSMYQRLMAQTRSPDTEDVIKRRCEFIAEQTKTEIKQYEEKLDWAERMINTLHAKASCDEKGNLIHRPFAQALQGYKIATA